MIVLSFLAQWMVTGYLGSTATMPSSIRVHTNGKETLMASISFDSLTDSRTTSLPTFIYGTAWKKDATAGLVRTAIAAGFKAIDTANQPRHYNEPMVGETLEALAAEGISRKSLFLQTKFTPLNGHDQRVPYDPDVDLTTQVRQSFESSLRHLKTDFVDSYLLHGPYSYPGLGREDWEVWSAMEEIHRSGRAGMIGVSNVLARQLAALLEKAAV